MTADDDPPQGGCVIVPDASTHVPTKIVLRIAADRDIPHAIGILPERTALTIGGTHREDPGTMASEVPAELERAAAGRSRRHCYGRSRQHHRSGRRCERLMRVEAQ